MALVTFVDFSTSPGMVPTNTNGCFCPKCRCGQPTAKVLRLTRMTRRAIHAATARSRFAKDGLSFSTKIGARPVDLTQSLGLAASREKATMRTGALAAVIQYLM